MGFWGKADFIFKGAVFIRLKKKCNHDQFPAEKNLVWRLLSSEISTVKKRAPNQKGDRPCEWTPRPEKRGPPNRWENRFICYFWTSYERMSLVDVDDLVPKSPSTKDAVRSSPNFYSISSFLCLQHPTRAHVEIDRVFALYWVLPALYFGTLRRLSKNSFEIYPPSETPLIIFPYQGTESDI